MAVWSKEVFAKNLKRYMEGKGKTQRELAEIIGVSPATLNEWLKAKKFPRIDKIEALAKYFGILKSDLIEEKTEKEIKTHKENDIITDAVVKMRTDKEFFSIVECLLTLEADKLTIIKQTASAFKK